MDIYILHGTWATDNLAILLDIGECSVLFVWSCHFSGKFVDNKRHRPRRRPLMAESLGRATTSSFSYGNISCYLTWLRSKTTSMHVFVDNIWLRHCWYVTRGIRAYSYLATKFPVSSFPSHNPKPPSLPTGNYYSRAFAARLRGRRRDPTPAHQKLMDGQVIKMSSGLAAKDFGDW